MRWAYSSERSRTNMSSGARRSCSRSLSSWRMKPAAGGGGEALYGGFLLGIAAHHADIDFRLLQVWRHAHFGDGGEGYQARVFQLAGKHGADFLADFTGDAFVAMSCDGHVRMGGL